MEPLLQQLQRFSEVLAVSGSPHVRSWDPATVRRALQWARYLRHVYRRFGSHDRIRDALERRLHGPERRQDGALPVPAWTSFQALERCEELLALRLLRNRALGPAAGHCLLRQLFPGPGGADEDAPQDRLARLARRGCALRLLRPGGDALQRTRADLLLRRLREARRAGPGAALRLLGRLWERGPRAQVLSAAAAALLPPPRPRGPAAPPELLAWLLQTPEAAAALCRLPAELLAAAAGRHPALARLYLDQLAAWARLLRYDPRAGAWLAAGPTHVPWGELLGRLRCLLQAPPPLPDRAAELLRDGRARDGGFRVPGLSVWTDLLRALRGGLDPA